jgi:hypothetical protein
MASHWWRRTDGVALMRVRLIVFALMALSPIVSH